MRTRNLIVAMAGAALFAGSAVAVADMQGAGSGGRQSGAERGAVARDAQMDRDRAMDRDRLMERDRLHQRDYAMSSEGEPTQDRDRDRDRDQDRDRDRDRERVHVDDQGNAIYGGQMMSEQERERYRARLSKAGSEQERERIRAEHREQMTERAREQGVTLPETD